MSIKKIEISNFKNIKKSKIDFKSNISAIYGQNGSGKTAIVESIKILQMFYTDTEYNSADRKAYIQDRMRNNEKEMKLEFIFEYSPYEYKIILEFSKLDDELEVKENILRKISGDEGKRKKFKSIFEFSNTDKIYPDISIDDKKLDISIFNDNNDFTQAYKKMLKNNSRLLSSFGPFSILDDINDSTSQDITEFINRSIIPISILELEDMGLFHINIGLPLAFHVENNNSISHGKVPFFPSNSLNFYEKKHYDVIVDVISQINILFKEIVPESSLETMEINSRGSGEDEEIQFEVYVCRNGEKIPLYKESTGIVKIISMLSVLIDFYNNKNAIVVIDELDSHIFEFLLNEILRVLDADSKGQLIFTSHNFSIMESLKKESIILSTMINGDVKYNYFKNVSKTSNLRDKYIRAMAIDSEDYISAIDINEYKIKNALKKSGDDVNV